MNFVTSHTIDVNVSAPQRNYTQTRPETRVNSITRPQTNVDNTKIVRIAHPQTNIQTINATQNITRISNIPYTVDNQEMQNVTESQSTQSTSSSSSSVDIYV